MLYSVLEKLIRCFEPQIPVHLNRVFPFDPDNILTPLENCCIQQSVGPLKPPNKRGGGIAIT